ncbi:MAG TPA: ATPase [Candidatus Caldiarchaeum subterraneum]|uniref:ATPase n=1 Tax=Caldiarchaeum subterraneum TaxID=311458 RepID=A0A832ZUR6_CALS0|nr:ATPase [Candidatus Caldarchaeum subterraneum]
MKIVPDTSVIIDGRLSQLIESGELGDVEIIIPVAAVDELQAQASKRRETGFIGLNEIKKLRKLSESYPIKITFGGERPSLEDIRLARSGRIDAIIRDLAKREEAVLYTSDYVQALVAEAEGIKVKYFPPDEIPQVLSFENYFTPDTLSLHLKEGAPPMAKRGKPGEFRLVRLKEEPMSAEELNAIIREITERARVAGEVEIMRSGAMVAQLSNYRVAIARPPFSDGLEVTIVRPIVKLTLEDYRLPEKLLRRLKEKAEGILISGPPGSGKSTFAASLAEFYSRQGKIVKTLESPRDLQVPPEITQYGPLEGDFEKTAEILLLVRPDYSVFDEIRRSRDFQIFADMRLAGVGMIGVVHASDPVDAIQRFIGRIELGMIPHIIDTVIFLKDGQVKKVYELTLVVKVPTGMTEADLARPVVEVRDFETGDLEYEIYTYGEENVIIPVKEVKEELQKTSQEVYEKVKKIISRFDKNAEIEVVSPSKVIVRVDRDVIPKIIGRRGETVSKLQNELKVSIDVEPRIPSLGREVEYEIHESGNSLNLKLDNIPAGGKVNIYIDDEYLFSATVGKKGIVKVNKRSEIGRRIIGALYSGKDIKIYTL